MDADSRKPYFLYHVRDPKKSSGVGYDGYIGVTDNFKRRQQQHFSTLDHGTHPNGRLQTAHSKAKAGLRMHFVAVGDKESIEARERLFVPKPNHHLNQQTGGGRSRGLSSEDAIDKISPERPDSSQPEATSPTEKNSASGKLEAGAAAAAQAIAPAAELATESIVPACALGAVLAASGLGAAHVLSKTALKDNPSLPIDERDAREVGRISSYMGGGGGAAVTLGIVYAAGETGLTVAGIGSGLAALGGGAAGTGLLVVIAAPAALAVTAGAIGYGICKFAKWLMK